MFSLYTYLGFYEIVYDASSASVIIGYLTPSLTDRYSSPSSSVGEVLACLSSGCGFELHVTENLSNRKRGSIVSKCLVLDSSIVATRPSISAPALFFVCVLFVLILLFGVLSGEPKQNQGRWLIDRKIVRALPSPPPSNYIASRPKAALLIWFFSDFRYGVLLFIVLPVICKYRNR